MVKQRLQVNISGGRTSGYMAWWLKTHRAAEYEMLFLFANTGFEHSDTLRFVNDLDRHFQLGLVWLEADVQHGQRQASQHRVVSYATAARHQEPFHDVIKKYGICNQAFKHCNRELKFNPMRSFVRSHWGNDYEIALGIRADERRRVSPTACAQRIVYPLVDWHPVDKAFIVDWWQTIPWDLAIPEYLGNCVTCYKKSDKKLNMVYRDNPAHFDFFARMEADYGFRKPASDRTPGPRVFWRHYRNTATLCRHFAMLDVDSRRMIAADESGGCSESCEPFEMTDPSAYGK